MSASQKTLQRLATIFSDSRLSGQRLRAVRGACHGLTPRHSSAIFEEVPSLLMRAAFRSFALHGQARTENVAVLITRII